MTLTKKELAFCCSCIIDLEKISERRIVLNTVIMCNHLNQAGLYPVKVRGECTFCCLLGSNLSDTDLLFVAKTRNTQKYIGTMRRHQARKQTMGDFHDGGVPTGPGPKVLATLRQDVWAVSGFTYKVKGTRLSQELISNYLFPGRFPGEHHGYGSTEPRGSLPQSPREGTHSLCRDQGSSQQANLLAQQQEILPSQYC